MHHLLSIELLVVGSVVAFIFGIFPSEARDRGTAFDLDPRLKPWTQWFQGTLLIAAAAVVLTTGLRAYWKQFFAALLLVGASTMALWWMGLCGHLGRRCARRLRSFYTDEPYHYQPYVSPFDASLLRLFQGETRDFSPANVLVYAQLARLAYESTSNLSSYGGYRARALKFDNHAGIVAALPSAVIVAFRGTAEARDWMTNLKLWTTSAWPGWGSVHAGFLEAVHALWPQVQSAISNLRDRSQPVWFTGRSLGGAMALIGALKLSIELPSIPMGGVYTFGQPRVGDSAFRGAFSTRASWPLFRIEACKDEVCDHPANGEHVGQHIFFDYLGAPHHNPGFFARFRYQLMRDPLPGVAYDHPMREYQRLIDGAFSVEIPAQSRAVGTQ